MQNRRCMLASTLAVVNVGSPNQDATLQRLNAAADIRRHFKSNLANASYYSQTGKSWSKYENLFRSPACFRHLCQMYRMPQNRALV